jgi:PAS domain S-box-containing protein
LCLVTGPVAAAQPHAKNVAVLYSFNDRDMFAPLDLLESSLRARSPSPVNFYVDYLQSERFNDAAYEKALVETLKHTYEGLKLDLVMVAAYPALQFAIKHRDEIFHGVPIVFFHIDRRRLAGLKMWPGVTGAKGTIDLRATFDLALRLHPNTTTIAIISDDTETNRFWVGVIHGELLRDHPQLQEVDLVGLPSKQLFDRVSALPPRTVALFAIGHQDSIHPAVGAFEILEWIGKRVPIYCPLPDACLRRGGVGGVTPDFDQQALLGAQLASRVLLGERPEDIPVVHDSTQHTVADWRQLRFWHIPESALPPGTIILNRPPSLWQSDRDYIIIAAIAVFVAQALLILALLWQRARKRRAEAVLLESETRFRVTADITPALIWMCDAQGMITYLNERRIAFTGRDPRTGFGDTWTRYIHPEDRKEVLNQQSQALKDKRAFSKEYRLRRSDGVYRWMLDVASPRIDGNGAFAGFIGSAIDVTDQKLAQQALEKVSGQLIEAQEKERTRIARDIHDDICQRLVLMSMELERANRASRASPMAAKTNLVEIRKHCSEIVGDLRSLSHELHSSTLDYLGIVPAIRGLCQEISKQQRVSVEFTDENVPLRLSKDVSLCLFRVAQEALHNAVKYSGTKKLRVDIRGLADEVQLLVSDEGTGFDLEEAKQKGGLGLVSMQERINLVHGKLQIESMTATGTRILALVPIVQKDEVSLEEDVASETTNMAGMG